MQGMTQGNTVAGSVSQPSSPDEDLERELHERAEAMANAALDLEKRAAELRRCEMAFRAGLETFQLTGSVRG